eukprot:4792289-Alexandrium_andersonii.AAC.1
MLLGASQCICACAVLACVVECVRVVCLHCVGAKKLLSRCGFNPEGNAGKGTSKSSLESAFELSSEPELP